MRVMLLSRSTRVLDALGGQVQKRPAVWQLLGVGVLPIPATALEMTYTVSGGTLNSTHSLTYPSLLAMCKFTQRGHCVHCYASYYYSAVRIVVFHFKSNRIVFVVLKPAICRHFRRL